MARGRKGLSIEVPEALVYERSGDRVIMYRDYEKVLAGILPPEAIMGSSKFQSMIIYILTKYLYKVFEGTDYIVLSNEIGFQWGEGSWRNLDIGIFEKRLLVQEGIDDRYARTPPLVVIEVDTKADLAGYGGGRQEYVEEKIRDLLGNGVGKVIWIWTKEREIRVVGGGEDRVVGWDEEVEVLEGIHFKIGKLLKEQGIF